MRSLYEWLIFLPSVPNYSFNTFKVHVSSYLPSPLDEDHSPEQGFRVHRQQIRIFSLHLGFSETDTRSSLCPRCELVPQCEPVNQWWISYHLGMCFMLSGSTDRCGHFSENLSLLRLYRGQQELHLDHSLFSGRSSSLKSQPDNALGVESTEYFCPPL